MVLVNTTERGLGLVTVLVGVTQVEAEDRLVDELLVDHVVEGRDDLVDGDGVVAQTQDTVEAAKGKGQARLAGRLSEVLVLDLQIADLKDVIGDEAAQAAGSVADAELRAVLLVGGRLGRVVLAVEVAGDGAALRGWHPQVGAASVKDDLEALGRSTKGDLGVVYSDALAPAINASARMENIH